MISNSWGTTSDLPLGNGFRDSKGETRQPAGLSPRNIRLAGAKEEAETSLLRPLSAHFGDAAAIF